MVWPAVGRAKTNEPEPGVKVAKEKMNHRYDHPRQGALKICLAGFSWIQIFIPMLSARMVLVIHFRVATCRYAHHRLAETSCG